MQSEAITVDAYLDAMPPARRAAIETVRSVILAHLPAGYVETMNWGMICYEVPVALSGRTYNGKPLLYAALGNQKNHVGLYLCGISCVPDGRARLEEAFRASGRKLDMGKACIRFRSSDNLGLDAVAEFIAAVPPETLVAASHRAHERR